MKKLYTIVLTLLAIMLFTGCDILEDVFGEKENNQLQQEFQVIKDGLNGYDELLINNSTTICYKAQESGLPSSLMILNSFLPYFLGRFLKWHLTLQRLK